MHGAYIDIRIAGYFAYGSYQSGTVTMVTEQKVATGRYQVKPVIIHPDNVRFPVHYRSRNGGSAGAGLHFHGNKAGIIFTVGILFFHYVQTTAGSYQARIHQINPFLARPLQQSTQSIQLKGVGIVGGNLALVFNADSICLPLGKTIDQLAQGRGCLNKGAQYR